MEVNPFTINVPNEVLEDLSRRLENVRWPDQTIWISRKNRGCPLTGPYASLKEVLATRAAKYSRSVLAPYGFDNHVCQNICATQCR